MSMEQRLREALDGAGCGKTSYRPEKLWTVKESDLTRIAARLEQGEAASFDECVRRVYQEACNRFHNDLRKGEKGTDAFNLAEALMRAWPEVIEPMHKPRQALGRPEQ